jgi:hypothetical protein
MEWAMPNQYPDHIELFLLFSRFEYALKRSGFIRAVGKPKPNKLPRAEADWASLAGALGGSFFEFHRDSEKAQTIFQKSPRRAVARRVGIDNPPRYELDWEEAAVPQNESDLVGAVRRIRNNLFHGDKTNPDHERNSLLISAALSILRDAKSRIQQMPSHAELSHFLSHTHPLVS